MKKILRVILPALLLALVLLGYFRVRAELLSHVYTPDAHTGSANAATSPSAPHDPDGGTADAANEAIPTAESSDSVYHLEAYNSGSVIGGGQTDDGFAIPVYSGDELVPINNNVPDFTEEEIGTEEFYKFSELDELGRAGRAVGCIGPSMLAAGERGPIGMIRPAGWHTVKYEFIDGLYLYNRCHLIAYSLCGVNADERNLITGTRYLNIEGMLGIENRVYWYVKDTGNHVFYRVTPRYIGDDLLAVGVQMEAYSVEDQGKKLSINVFCFNVQPGVLIDYKTGDNSLDPNYNADRSISPDSDSGVNVFDSQDLTPKTNTGESTAVEPDGQTEKTDLDGTEDNELFVPDEKATYILNTNTMRFHLPDCRSVQDMKEKNRKEFFGTREEAMDAGYLPCGRCRP